MVFNLVLIFSIISLVWLIVLSFVLKKTTDHYRRLVNGQTELTIRDVMERVLNGLDKQKAAIEEIEGRVTHLSDDGKTHFKSIGVCRYNPFADTGGAQSFSMSMLDGKGDGIVMTSLYARTGNRWYVKDVLSGKGKSVELSKEEVTAVENALLR